MAYREQLAAGTLVDWARAAAALAKGLVGAQEVDALVWANLVAVVGAVGADVP